MQWDIWSSYQKALLGLFFPAVCPGCGQNRAGEKGSLCALCLEKLSAMRGLSEKIQSFSAGKQHFRRVFCPYPYRNPIRNMILRFKHKEEKSLHRILGHLLASYASKQMVLSGYDYVTYVPLERGRRTFRGFNQSELLAHAVAHACRQTVPKSLLKRTGRRTPQERINRAKRLFNLRGVFSCVEPTDIKNKHLLLVDDVLTTGSTANECAHVLKARGARHVDVLVLARSIREN